MSFRALTAGLKFPAKNNASVATLLQPAASTSESAPATTELLDVQVLRKKHKIKLTGSAVPDPIQSFSDVLDAENEQVLDNLLQQGFFHPTPVQMQLIPILLEHRDVLACSRTGSGKTLAFALPLILRWLASKGATLSSVVIEPTRELARQVYDQLQILAAKTGCSVGILGEEGHETECRILVTTPLKLIHAIKAKSISVAE
jgi:ATP-dependent RNA helicase DDX52/ROK1